MGKYKGQEDIFVSYTHDVGARSHTRSDGSNRAFDGVRGRGEKHNARGAKIGINPRSPYDTPIGIYAYPVDYALDHECWVPYGAARPYVYVLRAKDMSRIVDVETYTQDQLDADIEKLRRSADLTDAEIARVSKRSPGATIWAITYVIAKRMAGDKHKSLAIRWASLFRALGYDGVVDRKGRKVIHENEPTQAVFFTTSAFEIVDLLHNTGDAVKRRDKSGQQYAFWENYPNVFLSELRSGKVNPHECLLFFVRYSGLFMEIIKSPLNLPDKYKAHFIEHIDIAFTPAAHNRDAARYLSPLAPYVAEEKLEKLLRLAPWWVIDVDPKKIIDIVADADTNWIIEYYRDRIVDEAVSEWLIRNRPKAMFAISRPSWNDRLLALALDSGHHKLVHEAMVGYPGMSVAMAKRLTREVLAKRPKTDHRVIAQMVRFSTMFSGTELADIVSDLRPEQQAFVKEALDFRRSHQS